MHENDDGRILKKMCQLVRGTVLQNKTRKITRIVKQKSKLTGRNLVIPGIHALCPFLPSV